MAIKDISEIKVNAPYKPRKLKTDPIHTLERRVDELKSKDPKIKREREEYRKKYDQKNGPALKRRAAFVRKAKKALPNMDGTATKTVDSDSKTGDN